MKQRLYNIFFGLYMRFEVWLFFTKVDLKTVDVDNIAGFWVTVAYCNDCGQPIKVSTPSCRNKKDIQACLEFHLLRTHYKTLVKPPQGIIHGR